MLDLGVVPDKTFCLRLSCKWKILHFSIMKCQVLGPFYIFHCFRRWQTFQNYQQSRQRETSARILAAGGEHNSKVKTSEQGGIFGGLASKVIVGVTLP